LLHRQIFHELQRYNFTGSSRREPQQLIAAKMALRYSLCNTLTICPTCCRRCLYSSCRLSCCYTRCRHRL